MKNSKVLKNLDKPLLIMCILYSFIGVLMVLSASNVKAVIQNASPYYYMLKQILYFGVGYFVGFFIILFFPTKLYKKYLPYALIGLLVLLVGLILYGQFTNSAKSWYYIGKFGFQPSEFAKLIIIIYLGVFFGNPDRKKFGKHSFLIPILYSIIVFALVALQPDLGTATIIAATTFLVFISIPIKKNNLIRLIKYGSGAVVITILVFLLSGTNFLNKMQMERLNFKEPCNRYSQSTGYQVCNGFIAINGGNLLGKGIGASTQKYLYLPEAHTDFIFAIFVEELGLIAGIVLLLGYLYIIYRIFLIAKKSLILRNSIICYGVGIYILVHLVLNLGGMLALMPLTGVTFPFLSYGGSSTLTLIMSIFVVERICVENNILGFKNAIKNI